MENIEYLFAVFAIIWVVIFAYVMILIRRQQRLKQEISRLTEILSERT
ncbi:CcmD family protein [Candidatus Dehalogenimonas loeffleri]